MDDIAPELLKKIRDDFDKQYNSNDNVKSIAEKITSGKATYEDAYDYAYEVGEMLSKSYLNNLSSDVLPDGKMYYNIAQRILDPTIKNNYTLITEATGQIQTLLNDQANLGIKAIIPELNQERINGIINRLAKEDNFDDVSWILNDPVKTFSQSIVDDSVKANAEFHASSGMKPKIVRKLMGGCCDWCRSLAGTYSYPNVPRDVYRRHNNCRCTVDYYPGDGKIQNVHSKDWRNKEEIEKRKTVGVSQLLGKDVTSFYYGTATPNEGEIIYENGYKVNEHRNEIEVAELIHQTFGGNIKLLSESLVDGVKTPDYLWRNHYWDLKTVSGIKSVDGAVRRGIEQIKENPGGIILDFRGKSVSLEGIVANIDYRIRRSSKSDMDVIVLQTNSIKVYRYKK